MSEIIFYLGEENGIVNEKDHFSDSIFSEQYKQALNVIESLLNSPSEDNPNIFAFCGDRGEGKTSCMSSVMGILKKKYADDTKEYIDGVLGDSVLSKTNIEVLNMIDPAFFDNKRNILEHVLGQLYLKFREFASEDEKGINEKKNQTELYKRIIQLFQKAKECLRQLDDEEARLYDPLEELSVFASGMRLHEILCDLFDAYLTIKGLKNDAENQAGRIVVCIDDIDLNIEGAYRMVEQIRKYLNNKYCLIAISVNIDQLIEVISNSIRHNMTYQSAEYVYNMSIKYVTKLIPLPNRIVMPKVYDMGNSNLLIYDNRNNRNVVFATNRLKLGVLRLIYQKVRYLFYNSKGGISPIVPNNLRSLRHLLRLLTSMDDSISSTNKKRFKDYFYKVWTKQLSFPDQNFVEKLTGIEDVSKINKYIVGYLAQCFKEGNRNEIESAILDDTNFRYNISVGDVFYLVDKLELSSNDLYLQKLLFFIRSFYSINLYELYDDVTENESWSNYFPNSESEASAYRTDVWFGMTNELQKFVAGSYFTYSPNDFLSSGDSGSRDLRPINGERLNCIVKEIKVVLKDGGDFINQEFREKFRLLEFFALTLSRSIFVKYRNKYALVDRKKSQPEYLAIFNESMGMFVFDIMMPFTAILNLQFAYSRFSTIQYFFEFALNNEWSLLRQMIRKVRVWRHQIDNPNFSEDNLSPFNIEKKEEYMHLLMSNGILRNGDIISAVKEKAIAQKQSIRSTSNSQVLISDFYKKLRDSKMHTYNRSEDVAPYIIVFAFLDAITDFLDKYQGDDFNMIFYEMESIDVSDKDVMSIFNVLFDSRWSIISGKSVLNKISLNPKLYNSMLPDNWENFIDTSKRYRKATLIDALKPAASYIIRLKGKNGLD